MMIKICVCKTISSVFHDNIKLVWKVATIVRSDFVWKCFQNDSILIFYLKTFHRLYTKGNAPPRSRYDRPFLLYRLCAKHSRDILRHQRGGRSEIMKKHKLNLSFGNDSKIIANALSNLQPDTFSHQMCAAQMLLRQMQKSTLKLELISMVRHRNNLQKGGKMTQRERIITPYSVNGKPYLRPRFLLGRGKATPDCYDVLGGPNCKMFWGKSSQWRKPFILSFYDPARPQTTILLFSTQ